MGVLVFETGSLIDSMVPPSMVFTDEESAQVS